MEQPTDEKMQGFCVDMQHDVELHPMEDLARLTRMHDIRNIRNCVKRKQSEGQKLRDPTPMTLNTLAIRTMTPTGTVLVYVWSSKVARKRGDQGLVGRIHFASSYHQRDEGKTVRVVSTPSHHP